jgi:hypothetical protein
MFNNGKKPIDVAIELDFPKSEICEICDLTTGILGHTPTLRFAINLPTAKK